MHEDVLLLQVQPLLRSDLWYLAQNLPQAASFEFLVLVLLVAREDRDVLELLFEQHALLEVHADLWLVHVWVRGQRQLAFAGDEQTKHLG